MWLVQRKKKKNKKGEEKKEKKRRRNRKNRNGASKKQFEDKVIRTYYEYEVEAKERRHKIRWRERK